MRVRTALLGFFVTVVVLASCGDDGDSGSKVDLPDVTQTFPQDGATDVVLNPLIKAWFDQPLDEATIDSAAFHVTTAKTYRVEYDPGENAILLYLREMLEPDSTYEVVADSKITGADGDSMLTDFTFSFTTGPIDCDHLEDYMEPNDDVASAPLVELDKVYPCLSGCGGAERYDYFKFVVDSPSRVRATARHAYSDTNWVYWMVTFLRGEDEEYCWVSSGFEPGEQRSARFSFLPGTYYVEMRKYDEDHHYVVYDLEFEVSSPCQDDIYEDNDFIDEAVPVTTGTVSDLRGCYVDRDFFSIALVSGQTLTVTATQITDIRSTRRMIIYNPGGVAVAETTFTAQGVPTTRTWTASEDGIHYFKIRWWSDGIEYELDVDVSG